MDYTVDMNCVMQVNRNCELCRRKVTEVMHCLNGLYSVDFVGEDNSMKLKGRVNPNLMMAVIERYGDHGKISNLRFDGEVITYGSGGSSGYYGQSGYYLPQTAGNYTNPYSYQPPYALTGSYPYPIPQHPPFHAEASRQIFNQHTAPPPYNVPPPPPRPLQSYRYVEPPYWPTGSVGEMCAIM